MEKMITLSIDFNGHEYCILAIVRDKEECVDFSVTVMNGELEKLLYGSHHFTWRSGAISMSTRPDETFSTIMLKFQVAKALEEYMYAMKAE